mgnify:CR=1 FL=1|jgi:hypothetical protein
MNHSNQVNQFFYPEQLTPLQQSNALNDLQQQLQSMQNHVTKLYDKIAKQQVDIEGLKKEKSMNLTRKRKLILEYINKPFWSKPNTTFEKWTRSITISYSDLPHMFNHDVVNGIQHCLQKYCNTPLLPICCFIQKPNTIYIWTSTEENQTCRWVIMTPIQYKTWLNRMVHQFLQTFLQWQMDNTHMIQSNENEKEKNISYMHKLNGLGEQYENRRRQQLRNWIYETFSRDFEINEYM